jgi:hypothetical protein
MKRLFVPVQRQARASHSSGPRCVQQAATRQGINFEHGSLVPKITRLGVEIDIALSDQEQGQSQGF